ncbi:MAG: murein L,D-transpeptidase, partial [Alphaproteobacteria bacterium]|nr:murein L,D-transpeptidase [Alphaproteobacteria bacterium]
MNRSPHLRALLVSAALGAAVALSGCNTNGPLPMSEKAARPLSEKMVSEIESKNMDKDSPILVRVFKEESELEVWKQDRTGRFALLKTYPICRWSGELGPKIKEGDRQAPEGFYTITPGQMNPNSQYYLSFDLGYPNAFDRAHGRTGSQLMVHGDCSSRGCYSMTDEQISEIYALGRDSFFGGQKSFQVQAYPFRMTPQNMAKHRNNPHIAFWKMLKRGNDHFEVSRLEPKINVCEKKYVFDAYAPGDPSRSPNFRAVEKCPAYEVPEEVLAAVNDKQRQDEFQTANLIRRGTPAAPVRMNTDGGMHPVFVAAVKRNELGVAPTAFSLASAPGTVPATVRPPRIAELADTPAMADTFDPHTSSPAPAPAPRAAPVRSASAEPAAQPASRSGSLFGNLFTGNAESAGNQSTPIDRMARLIGLR